MKQVNILSISMRIRGISHKLVKGLFSASVSISKIFENTMIKIVQSIDKGHVLIWIVVTKKQFSQAIFKKTKDDTEPHPASV